LVETGYAVYHTGGGAKIAAKPRTHAMQFGLFCSPKADTPGFGPETGEGFRV